MLKFKQSLAIALNARRRKSRIIDSTSYVLSTNPNLTLNGFCATVPKMLAKREPIAELGITVQNDHELVSHYFELHIDVMCSSKLLRKLFL